MLQELQRARHAVEVVHRLAHAHEDQVGGAAAGDAGGAVDLLDDLAGREVAAEAQGGGGAEPAVQRAADLRRDTEGQLVAQQAPDGDAAGDGGGVPGWDAAALHHVDAVLVGDEHRLDGAAFVGAEAELARAVAGLLKRVEGQRREGRFCRQRLHQLGRNVGDGVQRLDAVAVQPAEELLRAIGRLPGRADAGRKLGHRERA